MPDASMLDASMPDPMPKQGILLLNLGSPDSASTRDVRRYLREFLMDPRVIDAPYPV
jgi:ferrochelatase